MLYEILVIYSDGYNCSDEYCYEPQFVISFYSY